jgi:hypothetical protein
MSKGCILFLLASALCVGCADGDQSTAVDQSEVNASTTFWVQVTYGWAYDDAGATLTFTAPDCAPVIQEAKHERDSMYREVHRYRFDRPNSAHCSYAATDFALKFDCQSSPPRRTCDGQSSTITVKFGDPNGVDFHDWYVGNLLGTDGRSRQDVLVVPLDVHDASIAFSSKFEDIAAPRLFSTYAKPTDDVVAEPRLLAPERRVRRAAFKPLAPLRLFWLQGPSYRGADVANRRFQVANAISIAPGRRRCPRHDVRV